MAKRLAKAIERDGMTIVPLKAYFNAPGQGEARCLAVARGKKLHDKRDTEKQARLGSVKRADCSRSGASRLPQGRSRASDILHDRVPIVLQNQTIVIAAGIIL
jgi:hypothetical protein